MEWEILLKSLIDNIKAIQERLQKIEERLNENAINDKEHSMQISRNKEEFLELAKQLQKLEDRLHTLETARTEINGFAKYAKLLWLFGAAVIGWFFRGGN